MKRLIISIALALLVVNVLGVASVGAEDQADQHMQVELTNKQKKELSKLYEDIYEKKKKLISKYVEYGVMSKEKGDRIIKHMENRLEHIKQHGYMPVKHGDCHHHRHNEQEQ
jgi:hypothetical protein